MRDAEGKLWNLQSIDNGGQKLFQKDARKKGCFHLIGVSDLASVSMVYVVEGYATGASLHMATGAPVIVAFDAGNLDPVVEAVRGRFPSLDLVIAGDDDQWKPDAGNTGRNKAEAVAAKYNCRTVFPKFKDTKTKPTDFNDLHCLEGLEAVMDSLGSLNDKSMDQAAESLPAAVVRLAGLSRMEYDQARKDEAQRLGVRIGTLDQEVKEARKGQSNESEKGGMFPVVEIWPQPVNACTLFNDLLQAVQRFIVCSHETAVVAVLWCAFTWLIDDLHVAPLAVISAPEKRCGKSQLLDFMRRLSYRPLVASNISPAAVFRVIEAYSPTLLIDEADSFLKDNEELRGVINSGHTRQSAYVIRTVGDAHEPMQFSTWGAKALSGIGKLSETLMDRAIVLELRRKLPSESVQRLRHAEEGYFEAFAQKLARFAQDASPSIRCARPSLPESLNDRAQDNWEPLLAIADYVGGSWPDMARGAAQKISGVEQNAVSLSAELLADIQEVFEMKKVDRIATHDLLLELMQDDLKPWGTYNRGKEMTSRQLAKKLSEYSIKSHSVRIGSVTPKGFMFDDFKDAFARYLSPSSDTLPESATPPQMEKSIDNSNAYSVADKVQRGGFERLAATPNPLANNTCCAVADKTPYAEREVF